MYKCRKCRVIGSLHAIAIRQKVGVTCKNCGAKSSTYSEGFEAIG